MIRKIILAPIRFYQKRISPAFAPRCKYYPSCSSYAITAIGRYGLKGIVMAMWRVVRCNPWSLGGVDYVPEKGLQNAGFRTIQQTVGAK